MSTWLANKCIGLNPSGYGALLGEVCFTISRVRFRSPPKIEMLIGLN